MPIKYVPVADYEHADLPPPPRRFYHMMRRCTGAGYWLHKCDMEIYRQRQGGRYVVTRAGRRDPLLATDDLDDVGSWLDAQFNRDADGKGN